jgi:methionyl-tRNA synthetase
MLDQLGVPADLRGLDGLMTALPDGEPLPAPQGIFPRHVETAA